jgi:hypothetical protein
MRNGIHRQLAFVILGSVIAGSCTAAPDEIGSAEGVLRSRAGIPAAPLDTVLLRAALDYAASEAEVT